MKIEPGSLTAGPLTSRPTAADKIEQARKQAKDTSDAARPAEKDKASQAREEILGTIKALTEDGRYSVRFEKHKATDELVIKLVDREGEVIRQIPAEEIIALSKHLDDLRGKVIQTEG